MIANIISFLPVVYLFFYQMLIGTTFYNLYFFSGVKDALIMLIIKSLSSILYKVIVSKKQFYKLEKTFLFVSVILILSRERNIEGLLYILGFFAIDWLSIYCYDKIYDNKNLVITLRFVVPTLTSLLFFCSNSILNVDVLGMLATLYGSLFLILNFNTEEDIPRIPYNTIACIMLFHALVDLLNPYLKTILFYGNTFNSFYYNLFKLVAYCAIVGNLIKLKANLKDYVIQSSVSIMFMLLFILTPLSQSDSSLYYLVLYAIFHEVSGYMSLLLCSKIDDSYSYYNYISRNIRLALYIINYLILLVIT